MLDVPKYTIFTRRFGLFLAISRAVGPDSSSLGGGGEVALSDSPPGKPSSERKDIFTMTHTLFSSPQNIAILSFIKLLTNKIPSNYIFM